VAGTSSSRSTPPRLGPCCSRERKACSCERLPACAQHARLLAALLPARCSTRVHPALSPQLPAEKQLRPGSLGTSPCSLVSPSSLPWLNFSYLQDIFQGIVEEQNFSSNAAMQLIYSAMDDLIQFRSVRNSSLFLLNKCTNQYCSYCQVSNPDMSHTM
jgi:hypothetical protein